MNVKIDFDNLPFCLLDNRKYVVEDRSGHCFEDFIAETDDINESLSRVALISQIDNDQVIGLRTEKEVYIRFKNAGFEFGKDFVIFRAYHFGL